MANKKNNIEIIPAFTNDEKKLYKKLTDVITATQSKADGLARTISGALWEIKEKKLYMLDGYKNIYDYSSEVHGISRGTTSDAINTFARFRDPDTKQIDSKYSDFAWRSLIMMKSLSDEEIIGLGITSTMNSTEIKRLLDAKKQLEAPKQDEAPKQGEAPKHDEAPKQDEAQTPDIDAVSDINVSRETSDGEPADVFPTITINLSKFDSVESLTEYFREHWDGIMNSEYDVLVTK